MTLFWVFFVVGLVFLGAVAAVLIVEGFAWHIRWRKRRHDLKNERIEP